MDACRALRSGNVRRRMALPVPAAVGRTGKGLRSRAVTWFVGRVRATPTRELETFDGWRARLVVGALLRLVPLAADRRRAARMRCAVEWRVAEPDGGASIHTMLVGDGRVRMRRGIVAAPDLTIALDTADFLRLVAGLESGAALFMEGRLRLDGDPTVALRLGRLFRPPRRRA